MQAIISVLNNNDIDFRTILEVAFDLSSISYRILNSSKLKYISLMHFSMLQGTRTILMTKWL